MKNAKLAIATLGLIVVSGCHEPVVNRSYENPSPDAIEDNRLLIRIAAEENVYNGVAAERTVYPKDFRPGSAELNALGIRRVDMLVDASRGLHGGSGGGQIAVLRGDESAALYADRVAAVRQAIADAGVNAGDITVAQADHPGGGSIPSDRAVITYSKFMFEYAPKVEANSGGGTSGGGGGSSGSSQSNGSNSNFSPSKGQ